jgi:outer membrane immunogenic protein
MGKVLALAFCLLLAAGTRSEAQRYRWTGPYVGGNFGYGWGDDGTIGPNATAGPTTGLFASEAPFIVASQIATLGPLNTDPKGLLGGVQAGYNYQSSWLVIGIEADFAWANISGSSARRLHSEFNIPGEPGFGVTTDVTGSQKLESLATIRARVGVVPFNGGLFYVTGGPAFGRASSSIGVSMIETGPTPCITFNPSSGSKSSTLTGWTAGVGGEWAVAPNVSAKLEYLHYDLGTLRYGADRIASLSCPTSNPANTPFASVNLAPSTEIKGDLVRLGLNFKLSGP